MTRFFEALSFYGRNYFSFSDVRIYAPDAPEGPPHPSPVASQTPCGGKALPCRPNRDCILPLSLKPAIKPDGA